MSTLKEQFEQAALESKQLPSKPDPQNLLKLYALYKQSTIGDNTEEKPGFTDIVARAKWDKWTEYKGTSADAAMQQYIDLVKQLQGSL